MDKEDTQATLGAERTGGTSTRVRVYVTLALVLLAVGYVLYTLNVLSDLFHEYQDLIELFTDRKRLRALLLSYGKLAPLVFIVLQIMQVVFWLIPGEATGFLGGFVFGVLPGFLYSSIGLTIGSLLAFGLARWLGLRFVRRILRPELYQKFAFLRKPQGIIAVFLLFVIPGFPKDTLSYILGVSPIPLWAFFLTMTLGRLPGTWLLSVQGAKFQAGEALSWILLLALGCFLFLLAYLYRSEIMDFVRRHRVDPR